MAFDPNSAQPVPSGFDASSAQPVEPAAPAQSSGGFDPSSAMPVAPSMGDNFMQGVHDIGAAAQRLGSDWNKHGVPGVMSTLADAGGLVSSLGNPITNMVAAPAAHALAGQRAKMFAGGYDPSKVPILGAADQAAQAGMKAVGMPVDQTPNTDPEEYLRQGINNVAGQGLAEGVFKAADFATQARANHLADVQTATAQGTPAPTFVQSLFKTRNGIDTTPGPTPNEAVNPLSSQGLNADQLQQYHTVLKTGDTAAIHDFFDDKNVVPPSPSDINDWVNRRDNGPPPAPVDPAAAPPKSAGDLTNDMLGVPDLRGPVAAHINELTSGWKNAPDVEVINHTDEIADPAQQAAAKAANADDPANLGFYGSDGKVRIFANKIPDVDTLNSVLFHEGLGHHGLAEQYGDQLDSTINTLLSRNVGQFGRDVDAWQKQNPNAYNGDRTRAAEEVLANQSNDGVLKPSVHDAIVSKIRNFARDKLGMKLSYSDSEVSNILRMSQKAVLDGKGRDVAGNGFKKTSPYKATDLSGATFDPTSAKPVDDIGNDAGPKFMFTGKKATDTPTTFTGPDGKPRGEISDRDAIMRQVPKVGETLKLGDVLDHPELYKQYPQLKDMNVAGVDTDRKLAGFYAPNTRTIGLDPNHWGNPINPLLHEVQHAVQHIEEHSSGANSAVNRGDYDRTAGEIEARSTEARRNLDADQRSKADPYASQGVDPKDMIVNGPFKTRIEASREGDGFQTPGQLAARDKVPTTAEHEAANGPYVAQDHEFPETKPYTPHVTSADIAPDGFMTPEQIAQANMPSATAPPRFMRRSDLAANKDYVANDLEGIYKTLDEGYQGITRSWDEDRRAALALGFSPSQIKDLGPLKQGELSTRLYRMQSAANMADIKLKALNDRLDSPTWTVQDSQNYLSTLADRDTLIKRIVGDKTEYARALAVSKAASSYTKASMARVAELMKQQGSGLATLAEDETKFFSFAQQIKQLMNNGNTAGAHIKIAGVNKPYAEQYLNSFHFNMMLSALSTHVKAPIDMGTGLLREVLEKAIAIPIGTARVGAQKMLGMKGVEAGVSPEELVAHTYGMGKAVMSTEVYKQMLHAGLTGDGGHVGPDGQFVSAHLTNRFGSTSNPDLGPILSLPSHLVSAQDVGFRSVGMQSHMYAYGMREAIRKLGPNATFDDKMTMASSLALNPTQGMLDFAKDHTDRALLLNHNVLNDAITKFATNKPGQTWAQRGVSAALQNLFPFIRVESNSLINRFIQRSPLAFLDPYTLRTLKNSGPEADIALAKIAYGSVALGMAWAAAGKAKDALTGEPSENASKNAENAAGGYVQNAIHNVAKGTYEQSSNLAMSLFPWDQHNATAQIVASARHAYEDKDASAGDKMTNIRLAMESVLHNVANMSWMGGATTPLSALTEPGTQGNSKIAGTIADTVKTYIPALASQVERMTDNKRDVRPDTSGSISQEVVNQVKDAIPGLASTLPVKYNVYGQPQQTGATPEGVHSWVGEGNNFKTPTDPAEIELSRLAKLTPAAIVTPTQRTIKYQGATIKLDTQQAEDYQKYAGQGIVQSVKDSMNDGSWAQMSDLDKIKQVKDIEKAAKAQVRDSLLSQSGWLHSNQLTKLGSDLNGRQ